MMKINELKKIIKDVVKEAIQEELKDILFEAFQSQTKGNSIVEYEQHQHLSTGGSVNEKRKLYAEAINETMKYDSNDVGSFVPIGADPVNGTLHPGDVGMDQIMSILKK